MLGDSLTKTLLQPFALLRGARAAPPADHRFRELVEQAPVALLLCDASGRVTYQNRRSAALWGAQLEPGTYRHLFTVVHPDDQPLAERAWAQAIQRPGVHSLTELRVHQSDGSWRRVELVLQNLLADPAVGAVVALYDDLNPRLERHDEPAARRPGGRGAGRDPLLGLPTRPQLLRRLGQALGQGRRQERSVAVACLDLDRFRSINHTLGYAAGDQVLAALAEQLLRSFGMAECIARIGDDRFALLFTDVADASDAEWLGERLLAVVQTPLAVAGRPIVLSASVGLAVSAGGAPEPERLLQQAEEALAQAKAGGRGRVVLATPIAADGTAPQVGEAELYRALEQQELRLYYQPIVQLASGRVLEVEALLRWEHPTLGLLGPSAFLPLAEASGLIVPIGQWVRAEACRQARRWQQRYPSVPPLTVSVNCSAREFEQPQFVEEVAANVREAGLPPRSLKLELTESTLLGNIQRASEKLMHLKSLGVRLAIDDFGTGYSSLTYLLQLPVDALKIDRTFVAKLGSDAKATAIVQAISALGRALDLEVVAEGIETEEQRTKLLELGCQLGQGYYFLQPRRQLALDRLHLPEGAKQPAPSPAEPKSRAA